MANLANMPGSGLVTFCVLGYIKKPRNKAQTKIKVILIDLWKDVV
jgi:hypothetical protein